MGRDLHAFLTVISWPTDFSETEKANALVECVGLDPYHARLASRRNTPGIMREIDGAFRAQVLNALHARGVLSIAPTQAEIDAYPEAQPMLSIEQFPDADPARFVVAPRKGDAWTFTCDQVWLITCGRLRQTRVTIEDDANTAYGFESAHSELARRLSDGGPRASRKIRIQPVIDLHVRHGAHGRVVRLIGPRCRVGIVGDTSRPSLLDRTPPSDLLEAIMPHARIDREFLDFDPPASLRGRATKWGGDSNIEKLEYWSFYSSWLALIRIAMGD